MRNQLYSASAICVALAACKPTTSPTATASPPVESPCDPVQSVERVEVEPGKTVRTSSGLAITYESYEHDSYDDGTADAWVKLRFNQVMDDGSLSPSALSWMPSLYAEPRFEYLEVGRCVRMTEVGSGRVVLELSEPP